MKTYTQGIGVLAVIVAVAALALIGGGVYYASNNSAEVKMEDETLTATTTGEVAIKDLLGKNVVCTFTTVEDEHTIQGTAYIAGTDLRVDAKATGKDGIIAETHMIKVGTDAHVWSSSGAAAGQGVKMKVDESMEAGSNGKLALDWNKKLNYDCEDWNPDRSMYTAPASVKFVDLTAAIEANMNAKINQ